MGIPRPGLKLGPGLKLKREWKRCPVTLLIGVVATICSVLLWYDLLPDQMHIGAYHWWARPWQLITNVLLHGDLLHLLLNLLGLWYFGAVLEMRQRRWAYLLLLSGLAICSSLPGLALYASGIGLSGVLYGFAGYAWILGRRVTAFRAMLSNGILTLLIFWFFVCIILTETGVYRIANEVHAAGIVFGLLFGYAAIGSRPTRAKRRWSIVALSVVVAVASISLRPLLNRSYESAEYLSWWGYEMLSRGDYVEASRRYEVAADINPDKYEYWINIAYCNARLNRVDAARGAYEQAHRLNPADIEVRDILAWYLEEEARVSQLDGRFQEAIDLYQKSLDLNSASALTWYNLGTALGELEQYDEAKEAFAKAYELDLEDSEARVKLAWHFGSDALANQLDGRTQEAIDLYRKSLDLDSTSGPTWYNLGTALGELDQYDEAIEAFAKAAELEPDNDEFADALETWLEWRALNPVTGELP